MKDTISPERLITALHTLEQLQQEGGLSEEDTAHFQQGLGQEVLTVFCIPDPAHLFAVTRKLEALVKRLEFKKGLQA